MIKFYRMLNSRGTGVSVLPPVCIAILPLGRYISLLFKHLPLYLSHLYPKIVSHGMSLALWHPQMFEGPYWTKHVFLTFTLIIWQNLAESVIFCQISPDFLRSARICQILPDSQNFQKFCVIKSYLNFTICHNLPYWGPRYPQIWHLLFQLVFYVSWTTTCFSHFCTDNLAESAIFS